MKVFISWSGELSKQIGRAIMEWLPKALQNVKPWFSDDIEKGANWQTELFRELEDTTFSIIILTSDTVKSDWVMFETGAAAKKVGKSHACPILFGVEPADVTGPLASFQLTRFARDDFFKLFKTINAAVGDAKLDDGVLASVFTKWWPDLEKQVNDILSSVPPPKRPKRDTNEMIEETLLLVRNIQNALSPSSTRREIQVWQNSVLQNYRNLIAHGPQRGTSLARPLILELLALLEPTKESETPAPTQNPPKNNEGSS